MARQGKRWLISVDNVEEGRAIAERIDSALPHAHSFHEQDAVGDSEPVAPRGLVHVVTDRPREAVEAALTDTGEVGRFSVDVDARSVSFE